MSTSEQQETRFYVYHKDPMRTPVVMYKLSRLTLATDGNMYHLFFDLHTRGLYSLSNEEMHNPEVIEPLPLEKVTMFQIDLVREYLSRTAELDLPSYPNSNKEDEDQDDPTAIRKVGRVYLTKDHKRYLFLGIAETPNQTFAVLLRLDGGDVPSVYLDTYRCFCYSSYWDSSLCKLIPSYTYTELTEADTKAILTWLDSIVLRSHGESVPTITSTLESKPEKADTSSIVDHPLHYKADTTYETIRVMEAWYGSLNVQTFCLCNVLKYISRVDKKQGADGLVDLKKARWYLDKLIALRERDEHEPSQSTLQSSSENDSKEE